MALRFCLLLLFSTVIAKKARHKFQDINLSDKPLFENFTKQIINLNYKDAFNATSLIKDRELKKSLLNLSSILYFQGQEIKNRYYKISLNSENDFMKSINYLAKGYDELFHKPNQNSSFIYFFEAYKLAKETNSMSLRRLCIMGILEFYHYEFSQTNKQYLSYLKDFEKLASSDTELAWLHIYKIYFTSQSISKDQRNAVSSVEKLESIIINLPEDHKLNPLFLSLKAVQLEFQKDLVNAEKYHFLALQKCDDSPFLKYIKFRTCIRLAYVYYLKGKYKKGLQYSSEAEKYIDISDTLRGLVYINKYASLNNKGLGHYQKAFEQLKKSQELEYSLDFKKNSLQNSALEQKLRTAEKEKKIVQLQNINLQTEAKRIKNKNFLIGSLILLLFGSITAILINKNTKKKQRIAEQEREIEIQKTEKLLKEQELTAIDAMLAGQEKERQRLANDLHDNLGSTLATVKLHFQHLKNNKDNPKIQNNTELYNKTDELLEEAYQKVRRIAHEKNSGVMAHQGLLPAIKNLAKKVVTGNYLKINIQDFALEERLDNALEISIFRMIQELITNTIKHANASEINISLTNHDELLNIIVEDNGNGFDASSLFDNDGMGLATIEKRIEHLEGTFEVDSTPGKGTNILINIPI